MDDEVDEVRDADLLDSLSYWSDHSVPPGSALDHALRRVLAEQAAGPPVAAFSQGAPVGVRQPETGDPEHVGDRW